MPTTQAAIEKLVNPPKYVQRRGESFGRHIVFLLNGLPRDQKLPFIAGFVDVIATALDFDTPAAATTAKPARRKGRK